mmetsp:Transcript_1671/g.2561  ORF Transcript_1671/g.2561 Transcript_1671/m.2561 type:complete len:239 (+) Transcript_1671:36-752(+)
MHHLNNGKQTKKLLYSMHSRRILLLFTSSKSSGGGCGLTTTNNTDITAILCSVLLGYVHQQAAFLQSIARLDQVLPRGGSPVGGGSGKVVVVALLKLACCVHKEQRGEHQHDVPRAEGAVQRGAETRAEEHPGEARQPQQVREVARTEGVGQGGGQGDPAHNRDACYARSANLCFVRIGGKKNKECFLYSYANPSSNKPSNKADSHIQCSNFFASQFNSFIIGYEGVSQAMNDVKAQN